MTQKSDFQSCVIDVLKYLKDKYSENNYEEFEYYMPILNNKGYRKTQTLIQINFQKIIQNYRSDLEKIPSYIKAKNTIKKSIKGKANNYDQIIIQFIISYLRLSEKTNFLFSKSKFNECFTYYVDFIHPNLGKRYYFTPLHNFQITAEKKNIRLSNVCTIRKITSREFQTVAKLVRSSEFKTIGLSDKPSTKFRNLRYVLVKYTDETSKRSDVKEKMDFMISVLKLFKNQHIQSGGLYYQPVKKWRMDPIKPHNTEPEILLSKNQFIIKDIHELKKLEQFSKKYSSIKWNDKNNYIKVAIKKFLAATDENTFDNKILDYSMAAECLYTSDEKEGLTTLIATRVAALLGRNKKQRIEYFKKWRALYGIRSKIIHGESIRDWLTKNNFKTEKDVIDHFDKIVRESIKRFIRLSTKNDNHKNALDKINKLLFSDRLKELDAI